ncbi:MAG TPA: sigma-54 dependent transcriptional regulator [Gemmatimonadaceae bacterium]
MATILIVDDEPLVTASLGTLFARDGHQVVRASTGEAAVDAYLRVHPDLVLLDIHLPDASGFDVLERLREEEPVVIMITGRGDIPLAVQAMQAGAENFLTKPVDVAHLRAACTRALEKARLRQIAHWARERRGTTRVGALLGGSPAMRELAHQVELLAASDRTTVLLIGESGTGKGRLAEVIHALSPRAHAPLVEATCAGTTAEVLDVELFGGEEPGGAEGRARRMGLVEMAEGGTLFLDAIADLDSTLQAKLLRLLEAGRFRRPGETEEVPANVRVIAATSRDLVDEVNEGRLREDLYYQLSVMPVHIPPLRARSREDLVDLVTRLVRELRAQLPAAPEELTEGALEQLLRHPWPGNVRELRNALERAMIVARGARRVGVEHLSADVRRASGGALARHEPLTLAEVERAHIERTLRAHGGNRTRAARELGISRATLINKIKMYRPGESSVTPDELARELVE